MRDSFFRHLFAGTYYDSPTTKNCVDQVMEKKEPTTILYTILLYVDGLEKEAPTCDSREQDIQTLLTINN